MQFRSRQVLTSGGFEPVTDGGGSGHSIFARAFIEQLKANRKIIEGTSLALKVKNWVIANATQTPTYSPIQFAGHEPGGDFVFVRQEFARSIEAGAGEGRRGPVSRGSPVNPRGFRIK